MKWIYTIFNWKEHPSVPFMTGIYDGERVTFYVLYLPGTQKSLLEIKQNEEIIKNIISVEEVMINEFKSHLLNLDLPLDAQYLAYETHQPRIDTPDSLGACKKAISKALIEAIQLKPDRYRMILAHAEVVYAAMEQRGVFFGREETHPIYELAISGRSRTLEHNIQGTTDTDEVYPINFDHDCMVHLDWIAADLRGAAIMSGDIELQNTYLHSDPYSTMADELTTHDQKITRDDCKIDFFRSIYSLNLDSPSIMYYQTLHVWLKKMESEMDSTGIVKSILGREFKLSNKSLKNRRSVFNSMLQGTVAHAMHSALRKMHRVLPNNIMTETHDAIILSCRKMDLKEIIKTSVDIMLYPFKGELLSNPKFPIRVSVGTVWRQWNQLKEYR